MTIFFAFPGQGAQYPGLLSALPQTRAVRQVLEEAETHLHQPITALETAQALRSTRAVQLCLLIAGVASARWLAERGHQPHFVAGLSIGAYPAAVVAGALRFADALHLVARRAELMQHAYPQGYGLSAVNGLSRAEIDILLKQIHHPAQPLYLANINAPRQFVLAGSDAALNILVHQAHALGASAVQRLAVSVPSHCPLLDNAAAQLAAAFAPVSLQRPKIAYLSSTQARWLREPAALAEDLAFNMAQPVQWHATMCSAYERGARLHLELPPGQVLTALARPVFASAAIAVEGTHPDTLDYLLHEAAHASS